MLYLRVEKANNNIRNNNNNSNPTHETTTARPTTIIICDRKRFKTMKKMILTSQRHVKHLFADQNTQQRGKKERQNALHPSRKNPSVYQKNTVKNCENYELMHYLCKNTPFRIICNSI